MTNVEYIFLFAEKHNFPKTECEVIFNTVGDGVANNIYTNDNDIAFVRFDKSLVANDIKMEDIRFDIDSDFPDDVFDMWQKDDPNISLRSWIALGRYIPTVVQNADYFDELDMLMKDIEMKLATIFPNIEEDDGDSDYYDDGDSDYEEDEDGEE